MKTTVELAIETNEIHMDDYRYNGAIWKCDCIKFREALSIAIIGLKHILEDGSTKHGKPVGYAAIYAHQTIASINKIFGVKHA